MFFIVWILSSTTRGSSGIFSILCPLFLTQLISPDAEIAEILENYGREVGFAYQLADDLVDLEKGEMIDSVVLPLLNRLEKKSIKNFAENPNVVIYIVGLGNPDDEMMTRAAQLCGGEYFKPDDAGELLIWYSKRARDLTVKMKAHKE